MLRPRVPSLATTLPALPCRLAVNPPSASLTTRLKAALFLLISLTLAGCSQPLDDTAAIKHLLERESATWRAGDVAGHAACWHLQPYSRILVSTADG